MNAQVNGVGPQLGLHDMHNVIVMRVYGSGVGVFANIFRTAVQAFIQLKIIRTMPRLDRKAAAILIKGSFTILRYDYNTSTTRYNTATTRYDFCVYNYDTATIQPL